MLEVMERLSDSELENKLEEGGGVIETLSGLIGGVGGAVYGYLTTGYINSSQNYHGALSDGIALTILPTTTVWGYKIGASYFQRKRKLAKKVFARNKILKAMSNDEEFLERQGIKKGKFGKGRDLVKNVLTSSLGGSLSLLPGLLGQNLLCIYFGEAYSSAGSFSFSTPSAYIGFGVGAFAFSEMAHKKENKRIISTTFALAGINTLFIAGQAGYLNHYESLMNSIPESIRVPAHVGFLTSFVGASAYFGNTLYKKLIKK